MKNTYLLYSGLCDMIKDDYKEPMFCSDVRNYSFYEQLDDRLGLGVEDE